MTDTSLAPSHWIKPIQNVTMPERHIFVWDITATVVVANAKQPFDRKRTEVVWCNRNILAEQIALF